MHCYKENLDSRSLYVYLLEELDAYNGLDVEFQCQVQ